MTDDATYRRAVERGNELERKLAESEADRLDKFNFSEAVVAQRDLALAECERLRGVLDEIATINSLTATQPQFIRYLQNTAQAALCHGKDPDSCWNTRCNLGHKCRSALGETK